MHSPFIREWEDEIPVTQSHVDTALREGVSPFLDIPSEQQFFNVLPDFGKIYDNWKEKIGNWKEKLEYWTEKAKKNTIYANRLGWSKYSDLISELLLKTTGESNKDHTSAHFAFMVGLWQGKNGFSGKDVDGVIGPNTWRKMQPILGIKESTKAGVSSVNPKTVAKVQQYNILIEGVAKELDFNPNIVRGIIAAESNGNRYSGQGGKGYKGLMQARRDEDQFDPETSIRTGIGIYKEMRDRNLGPRLAKLGIDKAQLDDETFLRLVLCSYNAGHVSVLKALSYAKENGNWRDWFQGPYYKRGLLFTGAYSKYAKCGTEGLEQAKKDAALYKFKPGTHWMKQPDPPKWEDAIITISPLLRCWIETKHGNTPGYLNKILEYFRYFEGPKKSYELENEESRFETGFKQSLYAKSLVDEYDQDDELIYGDNYDSRRQDEYFDLPNETALYEDALLPTVTFYFSSETNAKKTSINTSQVRKSGIGHSAIIAALAPYVDYKGIAISLQSKNTLADGQHFFIDPSYSRVDSVFTEAIHQFQLDHFIDTKEHDGILGRTTLETLGIYSHGLKPKLNSSGFYNQRILNKGDIKSKIPTLTGNEFTAGNWYDQIIKPGFLGVKISDGIHILLYRKLKAVETWLKSQTAYKGLSSAKLGIALGFNSGTRYSGSRLTSGKQAMHGFGLALDIHVAGNPWIGAGWVRNDPKLLQERFRMLDALQRASRLSLPGKTVFEYLNHIAQTEGTDTRKAYATLKNRNDEFIRLLRNNSNELSYWKRSQTFGNRNPLNGFLNLHPDLVYALRQIAGLAWGAIDFGPRASGDIMHFDLRMEGVGKFLCGKIGGFIPVAGHPEMNREISHDEFGLLENNNIYEFHEAEENMVGGDVDYDVAEFEDVQSEYLFEDEDKVRDLDDMAFESTYETEDESILSARYQNTIPGQQNETVAQDYEEAEPFVGNDNQFQEEAVGDENGDLQWNEEEDSYESDTQSYQSDEFDDQYYISNLTLDFVKDVSKAIMANRQYGIRLGWNMFHDKINDLLLPFSGQQNVSLSEDAFVDALSKWQDSQGLSAKDSDGILGPKTWALIEQSLGLSPKTSRPSQPVIAGSASLEFASNPNIKSQYPHLQAYNTKRNQVIGWGVQNPADYIDTAISEWNENPKVHRYFGSFDGDPHTSYLNLKRLYLGEKIPNAADYIASYITSMTFFGKRSPCHLHLKQKLQNAEQQLLSNGHHFVFQNAWSFVPRTFNNNINKLSNHALGMAIDINYQSNPYVTNANEIKVIDAVCSSILPNGFLRENDPDIFRRASEHFKRTFNDQWISQQSDPSIGIILKSRKTGNKLQRYARLGFFNLSSDLVRALQNVGLSWGGTWSRGKDFMHFEIV